MTITTDKLIVLGDRHSPTYSGDPFKFFTFNDSLEYRLKLVNETGALIEGRPTKRLVNHCGSEYYIQLPWIYYFFTKDDWEGVPHLAIGTMVGSWKKVTSVNDPLFALPLPNLYFRRPCYYGHEIAHPTIENRFLIDDRSKDLGYPDFNTIANAHLRKMWQARGNNDGSTSNLIDGAFLKTLISEFTTLKQEDKKSLLRKSHLSQYIASYDSTEIINNMQIMAVGLMMWETKSRQEIQKYIFPRSTSILEQFPTSKTRDLRC